MKRFHHDLWNCDRGTLVTAARRIMSARGVTLQSVDRLGSGLYVTVVTTSGHRVLLSENEIRQYVWRHTNEVRDGEKNMPRTATFDGTYSDDTLIKPETDPWVEVDGEPVDWVEKKLPAAPDNDCDVCQGEPVPGALSAMNTNHGIERCDECDRFEGDLDAALALAKLVGGTVKYYNPHVEEE